MTADSVVEAFSRQPLTEYTSRARIAFLWFCQAISDAEAVRLLAVLDWPAKEFSMSEFKPSPEELKEGDIDYEDLMKCLENIPMTWLPAVAAKVIEVGYDKKVWQGSALGFMTKADARVRAQKGLG